MNIRLVFAAAALSVLPLAAADEIPSWVNEAAAMKAPEYPAKVAVVSLLQEEHLTVEPDGKRVMRERGVLRIVQPGRHMLSAVRYFNTKSGKIRDFRGWLLPPQEKPVFYGKQAVTERSANSDDPYTEVHYKSIACDPNAPVGSVFAYEVTEEEQSVFTTYPYYFQDDAPVLVSRFGLKLPPGWEFKDTLINTKRFEPRHEGGEVTWEMRQLPPIETEDYMPSWHSLVPRLALTFYAGDATPQGQKPMLTWSQVSEWVSSFVEPSITVTPEIQKKAVALTAGLTDEVDRIRAIGAYAQSVNYVSIQMNLTRGGGYTPHNASDVLQRNYGDCKDKSTLMRALLKALQIDSYTVAIYWGDRHRVREEWPAPGQFNHVIVAAKVSSKVNLPTVIDHPKLGRLLFFDPTAESTQVGSLPRDEQGSLALVIAGAQGELLKMPQMPPSANRVERIISAEMTEAGTAKATMRSEYFGESASSWRLAASKRDADDIKHVMERSLARRVGGITLENLTSEDKPKQDRFDMSVAYSANQLGQLMQGKMLIVRPGLLTVAPNYVFTKKERTLPVSLEALARKDVIEIHVPSQFTVDELPDPVEETSPYGTYKASWKVKENTISFEQSLEVKETLAEKAQFADVRAFFERVSSGQAEAVVLMKR